MSNGVDPVIRQGQIHYFKYIVIMIADAHVSLTNTGETKLKMLKKISALFFATTFEFALLISCGPVGPIPEISTETATSTQEVKVTIIKEVGVPVPVDKPTLLASIKPLHGEGTVVNGLVPIRVFLYAGKGGDIKINSLSFDIGNMIIQKPNKQNDELGVNEHYASFSPMSVLSSAQLVIDGTALNTVSFLSDGNRKDYLGEIDFSKLNLWVKAGELVSLDVVMKATAFNPQNAIFYFGNPRIKAVSNDRSVEVLVGNAISQPIFIAKSGMVNCFKFPNNNQGEINNLHCSLYGEGVQVHSVVVHDHTGEEKWIVLKKPLIFQQDLRWVNFLVNNLGIVRKSLQEKTHYIALAGSLCIASNSKKSYPHDHPPKLKIRATGTTSGNPVPVWGPTDQPVCASTELLLEAWSLFKDPSKWFLTWNQ